MTKKGIKILVFCNKQLLDPVIECIILLQLCSCTYLYVYPVVVNI